MTSTSSGDTPARSQLSIVAEDGLLAGVLGAVTVALFFLVVDVLRGQPLFTPSLLGSVLFLGKSAAEVESVAMPMVAAYTGVHFAAFVAVGTVGAYAVSQFEARPHVGVMLVFLFIIFEAGFFGATASLMPGVIGALGTWLVGIANLLSAAAMAGYLLWWAHPKALRHLEHVWDDA